MAVYYLFHRFLSYSVSLCVIKSSYRICCIGQNWAIHQLLFSFVCFSLTFYLSGKFTVFTFDWIRIVWHICYRKIYKRKKSPLRVKTPFTRESRPRRSQNFLQQNGSKWQVGGTALAIYGHCFFILNVWSHLLFFLSKVESVPPLYGPVFEAVGVTPRLWRSRSSTHKVM